MTNLDAKITAHDENLDKRMTNLDAKITARDEKLDAKITARDEKHAEEIKEIHKDLGEMKGTLDTLLRVMTERNK